MPIFKKLFKTKTYKGKRAERKYEKFLKKYPPPTRHRVVKEKKKTVEEAGIYNKMLKKDYWKK